VGKDKNGLDGKEKNDTLQNISSGGDSKFTWVSGEKRKFFSQKKKKRRKDPSINISWGNDKQKGRKNPKSKATKVIYGSLYSM